MRAGQPDSYVTSGIQLTYDSHLDVQVISSTYVATIRTKIHSTVILHDADSVAILPPLSPVYRLMVDRRSGVEGTRTHGGVSRSQLYVAPL